MGKRDRKMGLSAVKMGITHGKQEETPGKTGIIPKKRGILQLHSSLPLPIQPRSHRSIQRRSRTENPARIGEGGHGNPGISPGNRGIFFPWEFRELRLYLMFLSSAARALPSALKASSLPGARHLSGCSSTARRR